MNAANPKLPEISREYLNILEWREAVTEYTSDAYITINRHLRRADPLEPRDLKTLRALQMAFAQLQVFPVPIKVYRAVSFNPRATKAFVQVLLDAKNDGKIIRLKGFSSCTTSAAMPALACASVKLIIIARRGLDARPASVSEHEDELLLDHGTAFKVLKVRKPPGEQQAVVRMEELRS